MTTALKLIARLQLTSVEEASLVLLFSCGKHKKEPVEENYQGGSVDFVAQCMGRIYFRTKRVRKPDRKLLVKQ